MNKRTVFFMWWLGIVILGLISALRQELIGTIHAGTSLITISILWSAAEIIQEMRKK